MKNDINRGLAIVLDSGHDIQLMTNIEENCIEMTIDDLPVIKMTEEDLSGMIKAMQTLKEQITEVDENNLISNRIAHLANKMFNAKPDEQIVKMLKGEIMSPIKDKKDDK